MKQQGEIRGLLDKADSRDIVARYKVGRAICELWKDSAYGSNSLEKLAKLLGRSSSLIHNLARIARTWPDVDQVAELIAKANENGTRLTLSHLTELVREQNAKRFQSLMEVALDRQRAEESLPAPRGSTGTRPSPRNRSENNQ
jgi:hypothetical protein